MKIVLVEWEDAYTTHSWKDDEDTEPLHTAKTVSCGLLKKVGDDSISVELNQGRGVWCDAITIPRGCIKRIRYLRVR